MSLITNEYNYKRKSHRVDLPLIVEIDGKQYQAADWSLGGVGIEGFSPDQVEDRDRISAHIIIPMPDSVLSLHVLLRFVSQRGRNAGMAFVDLSPKHRRVLRHYIELSIEGKLENLEDLVSIVSSPQIASPIQEALNLSDLEEESLVRKFRQRSYLSLLLALIFLTGSVGIIFYNTVYRISTTGLISGTIRPVSAGCVGMVKEVFVAAGEEVHKGQKLFTVEDSQSCSLLAKTEESIREVQERLEFLEAHQLVENPPLQQDLRRDYEENDRLYQEAQSLFKGGQITRKDLYQARSYALRAKVAYERYRSSHREEFDRQQSERLSLMAKRDRLQQELVEKSRKSRACRVVSPVAGKVYKLEKTGGEYVTASDLLLLVNTDTTPDVVVKLLAKDALKIEIGMPATIYVPYLNTKYEARVSGIGYSAISGTSSLTLEASLNETLVKLDFVDPTVRFPVNSRVGVWIKTF